MAKGSRKRFNKSGRDQTVATVVTANNTLIGKKNVIFRLRIVFEPVTYSQAPKNPKLQLFMF